MAARCPRWQTARRYGKRAPHALVETYLRLVRIPVEVGRADQGYGSSPGAEEHGQLVVRLRQRQFRAVNVTDRYRYPVGHRLCTLGGRGLEQSAGVEPSAPAGLVPARDAWLGLELHGRRGADPHVPGIPLWRLQVSSRTHLDPGRVSALDDLGHGIHRAGDALRSGCVLGP